MLNPKMVLYIDEYESTDEIGIREDSYSKEMIDGIHGICFSVNIEAGQKSKNHVFYAVNILFGFC